jgi:hypothetical protein
MTANPAPHPAALLSLACVHMRRYDWGSCEAPNKANIERFTSVLAKCIKKAVDAGKDIAILAHLDLEKVRREYRRKGQARHGKIRMSQVGLWCARFKVFCWRTHQQCRPYEKGATSCWEQQ